MQFGREMDIEIAKLLGYRIELGEEIELWPVRSTQKVRLCVPNDEDRFFQVPGGTEENTIWEYAPIPHYSFSGEVSWGEIVRFLVEKGYTVATAKTSQGYYAEIEREVDNILVYDCIAEGLAEAVCQVFLTLNAIRREI